MQNYKLSIVYNGANYYGWQKQKITPTIQHTVENSLKKYFHIQEDLNLTASGRTDSGVHALDQVANVTIPVEIN